MYRHLERLDCRNPCEDPTNGFVCGKVRDPGRSWVQGWTIAWLSYILEDKTPVGQSLELPISVRRNYNQLEVNWFCQIHVFETEKDTREDCGNFVRLICVCMSVFIHDSFRRGYICRNIRRSLIGMVHNEGW
jgi:hypothetical protein